MNERWAFACGPLYVIPGLSRVIDSLSFKIQLRHYFLKECPPPIPACLSTFGLKASPVCAQSFFIQFYHAGHPWQEPGVGLMHSNVSLPGLGDV